MGDFITVYLRAYGFVIFGMFKESKLPIGVKVVHKHTNNVFFYFHRKYIHESKNQIAFYMNKEQYIKRELLFD